MDREPLISVITTVYNNERYITNAVNSVVNQGFDDYEYIIIDDGSTDNTPEIVERLAEANPKIRVIHQKNQWIYASFNNGIALARGKYVFILNSDDILEKGALELFKNKIEEYNFPDVIWTQVIPCICDEEQKIIKYDAWNRVGLLRGEEFFRNRTEVRTAWPYFVKARLTVDQANLYKREIIKGFKFRTNIIGADSFFNLDIASQINTALVIKEVVYIFYIYSDGKMNASEGSYFEYQKKMNDDLLNKYLELFESWGLNPDIYEEVMCEMRLRTMTREIRGLKSINCRMSTLEKIKTVMIHNMDENLLKLVDRTNKRNELESRTLNGLADILKDEQIDRESEMGFVYDLVDFVPRMGYTPPIQLTINDTNLNYAINNPLNPAQIGRESLL